MQADLLELPNETIRLALCETVQNRLNSENYQINVTSASQNGDNNFIGIVYRILFKGKDDNDEGSSQSHKLILKVAPQDLLQREHRFSRPTFMREIHMYDKVMPALRRFEESKGVIEENCFNEYPKCFRTIDAEVSESVFLEDLSDRGFMMADLHSEETAADHVFLVMKSLGKLHAISFALKDQQPQWFAEISFPLKEVFLMRDNEDLRRSLSNLSEILVQTVSGEEDTHLSAQLKKLLVKEPLDIVADCLDPKITGSAVISHGDAWQNNFMYRFNHEGNPVEVCLLDWQISRLSSPIIDIILYVFCCTTKDLRDVHYEEFLKTYHDTLSTHIQRLGSDPEKLFPFKLMSEHLHKFGRFGLFLASLLLPIITKEEGFIPSFSLDTRRFITEKSHDRFVKRLRDVIVDMVQLEYI